MSHDLQEMINAVTSEVQRRLGKQNIHLNSLSAISMLRLAQGCPCTEEEEAILLALLSGRQVSIPESGLEYKRYKETAGGVLWRRLLQSEQSLRSMGVQVEHPKLKANEARKPKSGGERRRHVLLTEAEVIRRLQTGEELIPADCILTPLARDYLKQEGLPCD